MMCAGLVWLLPGLCIVPTQLLFVQVIMARLYRKKQPFGGESGTSPFFPGQKLPSPPVCCSVAVVAWRSLAGDLVLPGSQRWQLGHSSDNKKPAAQHTQTPAWRHISSGNKNLESFLFLLFLITLARSPAKMKLERGISGCFSLAHQRR